MCSSDLVTWVWYADRLMEFPTALLGVALGVVLTPQLTAARASGDEAAYSAMLDWGLRLVVLLGLPCAAALLVFGTPLIATLFHYGQFSAGDVQRVALALAGYGAGLVGLVAVKGQEVHFHADHAVAFAGLAASAAHVEGEAPRAIEIGRAHV